MNSSRIRLFSRAVICLVVFCLFGQTRNAAQVNALRPAATLSEAVFVTSQTERGVTTQRLSGEDAARIGLKTEIEGSKTPAPVRANGAKQQGLTWFTLAPTAQLEAAPQAKAAALRVLAKWEGVFESLFPTTVQLDFGPTSFGSPFPTANTLAVTKLFLPPSLYSGLSQTLQAKTYDTLQQALYNSLPQDTLFTDVGSAQLVEMALPLARATGVFVAGNSDSLSIAINSNNKFDFDPSDGIDPDKLDFEAILLREVGRAMGFTSRAGTMETQFDTQLSVPTIQVVSIWDVFRFRNQVSLSDFATATRAQLSGGEQVFFAGDQYWPLSTGRSDGRGGDGRPAGYWKDDELTGQYIGIMDPTYAPGERGDITASDLTALDYFGYTVIPQAPVIEVLSNDDNSREETLSLDGAMAVTRLTPGRYPCKVQSVRVQLPLTATNGQPSVSSQMRIVIFTDSARTGQPPASPTLLLDRTMTIPALPASRMLEIMLPDGPTISAGDLYIGFQTPTGVALSGDANVTQQRSFITTDKGASFQPLRSANQRAVNLIARAVVTETYGDTAVAKIASVSPATLEPGSKNAKLLVYGQNFTGLDVDGFREHSVVRWNGKERYTEFVNGSLLVASLDDADVAVAGTARITVHTKTNTPEGVESAPMTISITSNRPVPQLMGLSPVGAQVGSDGLYLGIRGRDFTPNTLVRWNGTERRPDFVSSAELSLSLSKADLAVAGNVEIVVSTPAPGGGVSNKAVFTIAPCHYALSTNDYPLAINGGSKGILVTAESYCHWTAKADVPWITIPAPNGIGVGFLGYTVDDNYVANGRTGSITVEDTKLTVRQSGLARFVSAASFNALLAPESIATAFSLGITTSTTVASSSPLPTTLDKLQVKVRSAQSVEKLAPLFFTSPEQINFQVPAGIGAGTATIFISQGGTGYSYNYGTVQIAPVAPSFFAANASGNGVVAAVALRVKADGTQSYEPVAEFDPVQNRTVARPIDLGPEGDKVFLLMFGTGIRGRSALSGVSMKIGGVDSPVTFAGAQTDFVGLDQVNVQLPAALRGRGEVTINCTVDGRAANALTVTVK